MPPRRAASSSKRKADESDAEDHEVGTSSKANTKNGKKAKIEANEQGSANTDSGMAPNGQPTNKVLPVTITFPPKTPDSIRISSWNVCGLAASNKKVQSFLSTIHFLLTQSVSGLQILRRS